MKSRHSEPDPPRETYSTLLLACMEFEEHHFMMYAGVTEEGEKKISGIIEVFNGIADAAEELPDNLVNQGLRYDHGILFGVESREFENAISRMFGDYAQVLVLPPD